MGCVATGCWKSLRVPVGENFSGCALGLWECVDEHVSGMRLTALDGVPNRETMDNIFTAIVFDRLRTDLLDPTRIPYHEAGHAVVAHHH